MSAAMPTPRKTKSEQPTFEQTVSRLEEIVNLMDNPATGLEEMIALVEEGTRLVHSGRDMLNKAELRITTLENDILTEQKEPKAKPLSSDEFTLL